MGGGGRKVQAVEYFGSIDKCCVPRKASDEVKIQNEKNHPKYMRCMIILSIQLKRIK
jgi:hypothetical protein